MLLSIALVVSSEAEFAPASSGRAARHALYFWNNEESFRFDGGVFPSTLRAPSLTESATKVAVMEKTN
jgi:hypothetical protein